MSDTRAGNSGQSEATERDVQDRIALIENMMLEGRRTTEYWGWSFVLWGVAYLAAIGWSLVSNRPQIAWPVCMILAAIISAVVSSIKTKGKPKNSRTRGVAAIWTGVGCALFVYAFSASFSGRAEIHMLAGAIETLLGVAYYSSGLMLRWKMQQGIGLVYWVAAAACFYQSPQAVGITFIGLTVICQIGFGLYLMLRESRDKRRARAGQVIHA